MSKKDKQIEINKNNITYSIDKDVYFQHINNVVKKEQKSANKKIFVIILSVVFMIIGVIMFMRMQDDISSSKDFKLKKFSDYEEIYNKVRQVNTTYNDTTINKTEEVKASETKTQVVNELQDTYKIPGVIKKTADENIKTGNKEQENNNDNNKKTVHNERYIFNITGQSIYFIDSTSEKMSVLCQIKRDDITPKAIYLKENKLTVISDSVKTDKADDTFGDDKNSPKVDTYRDNSDTIKKDNVMIEVYDISNPTDPKVLSTVRQDGNYISSSMADGKIYVSSDFQISKYSVITTKNEYARYIPTVSLNDKTTLLKPDEIYYPQNITSSDIIVFSCIDISTDVKMNVCMGILGFESKTVMNNSSVFAYVNNRKFSTQSTDIVEITADVAEFKIKSHLRINGIITEPDNINICNKNLCVIASDIDKNNKVSKNRLYLINNNMNISGTLNNLGNDTDFNRVRFEDKTVYCYSDVNSSVLSIDCSDVSAPNLFRNADIKNNIPVMTQLTADKYISSGAYYNKETKETGLKAGIYEINKQEGIYKQNASLTVPEKFIDGKKDISIETSIKYVDTDKGIITVTSQYNNGVDITSKLYILKYKDEKLSEEMCMEMHDTDDLNTITNVIPILGKIYIHTDKRTVCIDTEKMQIIYDLTL